MEDNKDGKGIGGFKLDIAHKTIFSYWKPDDYPSPWDIRWKLSYIWWLDVNTTFYVEIGTYEISAILWNVYETLISNIQNDQSGTNSINDSKKFIPIQNLEYFNDYQFRHLEIDNIDLIPEGTFQDITHISNSPMPSGSELFKKYRYNLGTFKIYTKSKLYVSLNNKCCKYHKDHLVFECFRIKKIG